MKQKTNMDLVQQRVSSLKSVSLSSSVSPTVTEGRLSILEEGQEFLSRLSQSQQLVLDEVHDFAGKIQNVANKKFEDDATASKAFKE